MLVLIMDSDHLSEDQRRDARHRLAVAEWTCDNARRQPLALVSAVGVFTIFFQLRDCSTLGLELPWWVVVIPSLASLGLAAAGACTDAALLILDVNSSSISKRQKARKMLRLLLEVLRPTALWLHFVFAFMLYSRGANVPTDSRGRVVMPAFLFEPADLHKLACLVAELLHFLDPATRNACDGDIECITLDHGVLHRSVCVYDGVIATQTLIQRDTAAILPWGPVPETLEDFDLLARYGATLRKTDVPLQ